MPSSVRRHPELGEVAKHYPALEKQWVELLGGHPNAVTERVETTEVHAA